MEFRRIEFHRIDFNKIYANGLNQTSKDADVTKFKILADSTGLFLEDNNGYLLRSKDM